MQEKKEFIRIILSGRIDSINASQVEKEVMDQLDGKDNISIELDASGLEYISSSGLRVILRLRKQYHDISITGVNSGIYEILDMTGFTEM
nr:STAS domain-containing protein [Lachnospiraceae bacterium]